MKDKVHPIITRAHEYEIVFLGYRIDRNEYRNEYRNSYIDIHFKKKNKVRRLRFFQPIELEIGKGFDGTVSGMEILDIRDRQLDEIGVEVRNFEQDPGITFMAREVMELDDEHNT